MDGWICGRNERGGGEVRSELKELLAENTVNGYSSLLLGCKYLGCPRSEFACNFCVVIS